LQALIHRIEGFFYAKRKEFAMTDTNTSIQQESMDLGLKSTLLPMPEKTPEYLEMRAADWFMELGLTNPVKMQKYIAKQFRENDHQAMVLVGIYKMILPDWDSIEKITRAPSCGEEMWAFICKLFIRFDRKHHPDIFNGGLWMSSGFSVDKDISGWGISFKHCMIRWSK